MAWRGLATVGQEHCTGKGLEPERLKKQKNREATQVAREQSRTVPRRLWADPAGQGWGLAWLCSSTKGSCGGSAAA